MSFDVRLMLYDLKLNRLKRIATQELTFTDSDSPSLSFTTSAHVAGSIGNLFFAHYEYWDGFWKQPSNSLFICKSSDNDDRQAAKEFTFTGMNVHQFFLSKLPVFDPPDLNDLVDGQRRFNSSTPGAILCTLFDEGLAAGWGTTADWQLARSFTVTHDSAGVAWPSIVSFGYEPGTNVLVILQNMVDQGILTFSSTGTTLDLFVADGGADRSTGNTPVRMGKRSESVVVKSDSAALITDVILRGDGDFRLSLSQSGHGLGKLFQTINQGGVSDPGTATLLAQQEMKKGAQVRESISVSAEIAAAEHLPWVDYGRGDWIKLWKGGQYQRVRVYELVVIKKSTLRVTAVLNDSFTDILAKLAKRTVGITGGAVAGGNGSTPTRDDKRRPKAPVGLVMDSTGYFDNHVAKSQISAEWEPVTQGENNVAIDVQKYELWVRPEGEMLSAQITTSTDASVSWSPFDVGTKWFFKVRAVSKNDVPGAFSAEVEQIMDGPMDLLDAPTTPTLSSALGNVTINWDGLLEGGLYPPSWFVNSYVEMSETENGDYETVGTLIAGRLTLTGLGIGNLRWFRLVAVDVLQRRSNPSPPDYITVVGIAGPDIEANSITANQIAAGSIEVQHLSAGIGQELDISSNQAVNLILNRFETVEGDLSEQEATLNDLSMYYRFTPDGALIGKANDPLQLSFTNEAIQMLEQGNVIAEWRGATMYLDSLEVLNRIVLGNHQIEKYGSGTVVRSV